MLSLASTAVQANELSGYVSGSLAQPKAEKPVFIEFVQDDAAEYGFPVSFDRSDTAYKLIAELNFNPDFAVEAQYVNLGKSNYKIGCDKLEYKTQGFGANLVCSYPIEDFTVFAKASLHLMKTKMSVDGRSNSQNAWVSSVGIGASYNINKNIAVLAEYEHFNSVANKKKALVA